MHLYNRKRDSRRQVVGAKGRGVLNTLINKLPVELHIPGYRFCGPGTRLKKRLARGDRGINPLDEACREHDIAYARSNDLHERHVADKILANKAWERVRAKDSTLGERTAALTVTGIMKGKTKLGMGVHKKVKRKHRRRRTGRGVRRVGRGVSRVGKRSGGAVGIRRLLRKRVKKRAVSKARVLNVPKRGGILPLIPIISALGALGSLGGGAAAIAKAVGDSKAQKKAQFEKERHNKEMEAIARGKGLYLRPHNPKNYR